MARFCVLSGAGFNRWLSGPEFPRIRAVKTETGMNVVGTGTGNHVMFLFPPSTATPRGVVFCSRRCLRVSVEWFSGGLCCGRALV